MMFETERLVIRDFLETDVDVISAFYGEAQSQENILRSQRDPRRIHRFLGLILKYNELVPDRTIFYFVVVEKASGEVLGTCSLSNGVKGGVANLGWHFGSRFSGRGYATEAAAALLEFGFSERLVRSIFSDCFESNGASIRVFEKLRMSPVNNLRVKKYLFALKYMEPRPIVRWFLENKSDA